MTPYLVQQRDKIFAKGYKILSFAKNIGRNIGKNLSNHLNMSKYN